MGSLARERHPELFANIQGDKFVAFVLDENCAVLRDTVLADSGIYIFDKAPRGRALFAKAFGDTSEGARGSGMGLYYKSSDRKSYLIVAYTVRPSAAYRARTSRTPCGIGIRFDESCNMSGPLELRVLDSVHALIAVRRFRAQNQGVDNLFLITLSRPRRELATQSMLHGIVVYQSGAVYVEDFLATQPLLWFGTPTTRGVESMKHRYKVDVSVIDDVLGIAHYVGHKLTLEQVAKLRPASVCAGPAGSCFEVDGQRLEFP